MASQESSKMQEEGSGRQVPEGPIHCLNNCGFFGSAATMNLCSKCYRELNAKPPSFSSHLKPQQPTLEQPNAKHPSIPLPSALVPSSSDVPMVEAVAAVETAIGTAPSSSAEQEVEKHEQDEEEQLRKSKKRCFACNRRVGLTGFKCRCGDLFCAQHRSSQKCKFAISLFERYTYKISHIRIWFRLARKAELNLVYYKLQSLAGTWNGISGWSSMTQCCKNHLLDTSELDLKIRSFQD